MLGLWTLLSLRAHAQSAIGVSVAGDVPMTLDKVATTRIKPSGGGEISFVYQLRRNHFLFQTGLGYSLQVPRLSIDSASFTQAMIDTRGVQFLYVGLLRNRTDRMMMHQLVLPLLVGGTWQNVYFLVGAKVCLNLETSAAETALLKTAGDYGDRYYEWLEDMPNHGYHDFEAISSKQRMRIKPYDLRLMAEIGYTYRIVNIGLFAEGGLLNLRTNDTELPVTTLDYTEYLRVSMNHVYTTSLVGSSPAHFLSCGVRVTVLFPIAGSVSSGRRKNYPCRCIDIY